MFGEEELHKPSYIAAILVAIAVAIADVTFTCLSSGMFNGFSVFENGTIEVIRYYETPFTPYDWSASTITTVTVIWQAAWMVYSLTTLVRYTSYGYMYIAPGHMHPHIYIAYILGVLAHMVWVCLINLYGPPEALIVIPVAAFFLFLSYGLSCHRLYYRGHILQREGAQREALHVRLWVQNGIAIYATWSVIILLLNLDMTLIYHFDVNSEISGTIVHAALLFYIIVWFFLDNFVCDRFLRYTFSPYFVFLVYQAGCFANKDRYDDYLFALVSFILGVACLASVLKIIILIRNQLTAPLWLGNGFFVHHSSYGSLDMSKQHKILDKDSEYY